MTGAVGGKAFDVLGIGDCDVDLYIRVPRLPRHDEKIHGRPLGQFPGGVIGNFCCAAARLGSRVAVHTVLGDDAFGALTLQSMVDFGVDTRGVRRKPGEQTYFCVISLDDSGEKALTLARTPAIFPGSGDLDPALIASARLFRMAPFDLAVATEAAGIARAAGAAVSVDLEPGSVSEGLAEVERLLARTDVCIVNEFGLRDLFGADRLEEGAQRLRRRGPRVVLVTRGAAGAVVVTADGARAVPGIAVDVVDTTGAGDACSAAFLTAWLEGWPPDRAARFACAAGALATRAVGSRSSLPTRAEALAAAGPLPDLPPTPLRSSR